MNIEINLSTERETALSKMQKPSKDFVRIIGLHFLSPSCFSLPKDYLFPSPSLSALIPSPQQKSKGWGY